MFIVLYRTGGAGSKLRKYTIGPYGRVTLHQARVAAQKVFAARLDGRDPAAEKREKKRRVVADRVEDLLEAFIDQRLSQNRSGAEIARLLRREMGKAWAGRSIHEISKRDVVEVISAIEQRGAPAAANKALKSIKTFIRSISLAAPIFRDPVPRLTAGVEVRDAEGFGRTHTYTHRFCSLSLSISARMPNSSNLA